MRSRIKYTDEPLGKLEVVPDFLPAPEDLVFRDEGVKVTKSSRKRSVEFFESEARRHNTQYQRMIRRLLDAYTDQHSRPLTPRLSRQRVGPAAAARLRISGPTSMNLAVFLYTYPKFWNAGGR